MNNVWIGTDWHLYSSENDPRHPFRSNRNLGKLSDQFAQDIQEDDLLIFLGDLCDPDASDINNISAIVRSIPCHKIMCRGNHDVQDDAYYLEAGFDEICDVVKIHNIVFSHKPLRVAPDELNIHGHLHTEQLAGADYQHINAYAANWNTNDHPVLLEDLLASATVQDIEVQSSVKKYCEEETVRYTSIENDHYLNIMDISEWFPLCPVDEAQENTLANIISFNDWVNQNFHYGLRINGVWDPKRNTTAQDWDKYLIMQSPEEIGKSRVGVCWDYTSYEAWYFKRNFPGVKVTTWYIVYGLEPDCPTHTFLTFEYQRNHYYFEVSFDDVTGVWAADNEKDILNFVIDSMMQHDPRLVDTVKKFNYGIFKYDALDSDLYGLGCEEYMGWMLKNGKEINHRYNKNYKAPVKMNVVLETSTDILDEILFADPEDTKYWLADDDEYRKKAEKGKESDTSVAALSESTKTSFNPNLVHLSYTPYEDDDQEVVLTPSIPDNFLTQNGYEDNTTPRVCFSTSISKALRALAANVTGMEFAVYVPRPLIFNKYKVITPDVKHVPDVNITEERWICDPVRVIYAGTIRVKGPVRGKGHDYTYGENQKATLYDWAWEWVEKKDEDIRGRKITLTEDAELLNEMAYEDAADLMRHRLGHYCREFNNSQQFEQIVKTWKKNWPNEKPPKLSPYMVTSGDNQLCLNLAHEINTDNDDGLQKVVTYTKIMHDLRKKLEKDKEIKDCAYIVGMYDLVEDGVLLYVNLKGIDAFSADSPEVYWPDITAFEQPRKNENDYVSHDGVRIVFENDKHIKIGEVSISSINTDEPYLYDLEVYSRYRGKNYGNAIMRYVMGKYKPTELCVEWKNEIAQKLYERFGFKKDAVIADYHTTLIVMRTKRKYTGSFKSNEESISEAVANTHPVDREQKADIAKKYGLRSVGDTHEASKEEEEAEKKRKREQEEKRRKEELDKKRKKRLKALERGRRTQKRNRFIKKIKSHLPGVKNERADALNMICEYDDIPPDESVTESTSYRFEMLDHIQFFDRIDETANNRDKLHPVYVVLIQGNSPISAAIRGLTGSVYTHVSISFDSSLKKMYSFASKEKNTMVESLVGGFKMEDITQDFYKKNVIPYAVYVVPSTQDEINRMKKRLEYFIKNETKFTFDYLGLIRNFFKVPNNPENTYFCSRFVADVLNAGNPDKKKVDEPSLFRPEDVRLASFAYLVDLGIAKDFDQKNLDKKTKAIINGDKMRKLRVNESYDLIQDNPWQKMVLNYQLTMMDEAAVDEFIMYLQSFKIRFDKNGDILITRREYDQLDMHFRQSMKMIKAYEEAGNVEGVKTELCKIHYMIELINQYYLRPDTKNLRENAKDVRKDMLDLRSVMLNVFKQHMKYVTVRDPRWNFQKYYDNSDYGKNIKIPQKLITQIGTVIATVLK